MFFYIFSLFFFLLMIRLPPISTLFPYTTLFRSIRVLPGHARREDPVGSPPHDPGRTLIDWKSTRLNSSHGSNSYAVFCLKKKKYPRCPLIRCVFTSFRELPSSSVPAS